MAHDKYYAICENKCLVDITHLENKRGQYVGNGSATKRDITIDGEGDILMITSTNGMAMVTPYGAFCKAPSGTTLSGLSWSEIMFQPAKNLLTIKSTHDLVNMNAGVFNWYRF